jgi:hypothetical protein
LYDILEGAGKGRRKMSRAIYLEKRFAKDPSIVPRKIRSAFILVPIRQKASDVESIYTLNDSAARAWELIDGERQVYEIRDAIVEEFEVGPEEAETDLVELLQQMESVGAIRET